MTANFVSLLNVTPPRFVRVSLSGHPKGGEGPKIASLERATMLLLLSAIPSLCVLQVFGVNVLNTQPWLSLRSQASI